MDVRMIWFDFGGVLGPSPKDLFTAYHRKTGITAEQLAVALREVSGELGRPALAALELGAISEPDWGRLLGAALTGAGVDVSRARPEEFGRQWFEGTYANAPMLRAVRYVRDAGYRVGVLSNNVREWQPYWRRMIEPAGEFDRIVDSSEIGVRKPDPRILRIAEDTAGAAAAECVLVDDVAENCAAAEAAGWRAVDFGTTRQCLTDLGAVLDLPGMAAACLGDPATG